MEKGEDLPQEKRGWLRNGNLPGDFTKAPRCGAKTRAGTPCKCPAMPNGRCRLHGGKSTGPKTKDGKERSKRGNWKHGEYSVESKKFKKSIQKFLKKITL